jgi:hypothetical protein
MDTSGTIATQKYEGLSHPSARKTSMRKKIVAGLLGGAVIAIGMALAPAAHANDFTYRIATDTPPGNYDHTVFGADWAHANSDDDAFLAAVHNQGMTDDGGDAELIKFGHMMCTLLGDGYSTNGLIQMGQLHATRISADDVKLLVQSAEAAFCPQYIQ